MRTTYIANTTEAANLHSGKQTAIVTLVKPQPEYFLNCINGKPRPVNMENFRAFFSGGFEKDVKPPYQPGQTIAVRESCFSILLDGKTKFIYPDNKEWIEQIELDNYRHEDEYVPVRFGSPVTMPREAVRTRLLVKYVACVRVQDMTTEQAQAIWPDMSNIERMQDLHRRFGQSAWENNVFIFITKVEKI